VSDGGVSRPRELGDVRPAGVPELVEARRVRELAGAFFGVPVHAAVRFVDVLRGYTLALDYVATLRELAGGVRLPELDAQLTAALEAEASKLRADRRDPGLTLLGVVVAFLGERDPTFAPPPSTGSPAPAADLPDGPSLSDLLIADREHHRGRAGSGEEDRVPEDG
jgi:hypothetical protein